MGVLYVLGGSWVGISGVITTVILLITLLITNHEPPSRLVIGFRDV